MNGVYSKILILKKNAQKFLPHKLPTYVSEIPIMQNDLMETRVINLQIFTQNRKKMLPYFTQNSKNIDQILNFIDKVARASKL